MKGLGQYQSPDEVFDAHDRGLLSLEETITLLHLFSTIDLWPADFTSELLLAGMNRAGVDLTKTPGNNTYFEYESPLERGRLVNGSFVSEPQLLQGTDGLVRGRLYRGGDAHLYKITRRLVTHTTSDGSLWRAHVSTKFDYNRVQNFYRAIEVELSIDGVAGGVRDGARQLAEAYQRLAHLFPWA